ncbi:MAG: AmmeMemoRadiSam system protein B [Planctomycetes bacterium]|nr:AmmeMemoRadiSam system protein B [Planctomycetota bacterium]
MEPMPALRPEIDAVPTEHNGETMFILHDRSGLSTAQMAVSPLVMYISLQLDGKTSILSIQENFEKETGGQKLPLVEIEHVLESLESSFFLKGSRFEDYYQQVKREFMTEPVRVPLSAGSAYSDNPEELSRNIQEMLSAAPDPEERLEGDARGVCPRGVIAPHIDYPRGAAGYAQVYKELSSRKAPETVIIIGTAHHEMKNRFSILKKDFEIPGDIIRCDKDMVDRILGQTSPVVDFTEDAFAHRAEHSIELQVVWLRHIWGKDVKIIPVLAGSMQEFLVGGADCGKSADDRQLSAFTSAIKRVLEGRDGDIMLIASADLAHVGPRFGDEREITSDFLEDVERTDREYLRAVASGDALAGLKALAKHEDSCHVCGTGCIHALTAILSGISGRLLGYHQAATPEMQQAVTFAGMIFE